MHLVCKLGAVIETTTTILTTTTIPSVTEATTNLHEAHLGCYDDEVRTWDGNQNLVTVFNDDNSPAK